MKLIMFEFSQDLPVVMSVGTLVALLGTIIHYTSKITAFKKEMELKCKDVDERVAKIENLELWVILAKIQSDLEWLKNEWLQMKK